VVDICIGRAFAGRVRKFFILILVVSGVDLARAGWHLAQHPGPVDAQTLVEPLCVAFACSVFLVFFWLAKRPLHVVEDDSITEARGFASTRIDKVDISSVSVTDERIVITATSGEDLTISRKTIDEPDYATISAWARTVEPRPLP
jgi:hypothetical protein